MITEADLLKVKVKEELQYARNWILSEKNK